MSILRIVPLAGLGVVSLGAVLLAIDPPGGYCSTDSQCDDGVFCTFDICVSGQCQHQHGDPCCPPDGCCRCDDYENCYRFFGTCCNEATGCCEGFEGCVPDEDEDGVHDKADVCRATPIGTSVDSAGRPLGDLDGDCDTDLDDYRLFGRGFTGPL